MVNPAGYLYRVGQSRSRRFRRPRVLFPRPTPDQPSFVEPALPTPLEGLTRNQRVAVTLIHALGWTEREAADGPPAVTSWRSRLTTSVPSDRAA
jgi:hypothetical protein